MRVVTIDQVSEQMSPDTGYYSFYPSGISKGSSEGFQMEIEDPSYDQPLSSPEDQMSTSIAFFVPMSIANLTTYSGSNFSDISPSFSRLWNESGGLDLDLISRFKRNRTLEGDVLAAVVIAYSVLIVLGSAGNSLVVLAVIRKPAMRTARNVFIINLAISDLILCLATTPLTAVEILTQYWPLGNTPILCKLVGTLQATSIFVSTVSITYIALDRYKVILYPTQQALGTKGALLALPSIWAIALFLAVPQFLVRSLKHYELGLPGVEAVDFCYESWPIVHGAAVFSLFVMLVQFFVPLLTISISYARIVQKLKYRMTSPAIRKSSSRDERKRNRKTNILLTAIALVFCLSWLPLNLYNIIVDLNNPFGDDKKAMLTTYALCHMVAMSSACSNPILYGWLNDNFKKEFTEIYHIITPCLRKGRSDVLNSPVTRMVSVCPNEEKEALSGDIQENLEEEECSGKVISEEEYQMLPLSEFILYNNNGVPCYVNKNAIHTIV